MDEFIMACIELCVWGQNHYTEKQGFGFQKNSRHNHQTRWSRAQFQKGQPTPVKLRMVPFLQAVRLFIYLFIYLQVATTLLVAGSTLDTLADSVCINQVVLKRHSKHQAAG